MLKSSDKLAVLAIQTWTGTVSELIAPNYGIVDGEAFFVNQVVAGRLPQVNRRMSKHTRLFHIAPAVHAIAFSFSETVPSAGWGASEL